MRVEIKKATIEDSDFLLSLRNEKSTKKNSFNTNKINKKNHKSWFKKELDNKETILLIAYKNFEKIGSVKYIFKDIFAYVSISIEKNFRNLGYGSIVLKAAELFLKKRTIIVAKVKKGNKKSINIFKKNKFTFFSNKKYITLIKILKK
tara:strand:+ start:1218 stop:1661 length:444 start_codon:yes stop_codon:yes gene_type:complete